MTLIITALLGYVIAFIYEKLAIKISKNTPLIINGYQLHHSLYGLALSIIFIFTQNLIILGLALGILVQHILTDGFRFISKERHKTHV